MTDVIRREENALTVGAGGRLSPKWSRVARRAIDQEIVRGLHGAARAQAAGFIASARVDAAELVTERIMVGLDRLSRVEAAMARNDPLKAERVAGLVDDYLLIARCELRNLTREF